MRLGQFLVNELCHETPPEYTSDIFYEKDDGVAVKLFSERFVNETEKGEV